MTATPKALTLQRPWGWAILYAGKDVENRSWSTRYRGPLFIHQGSGRDKDGPYEMTTAPRQNLVDVKGVILGWVTLTDVHHEGPDCCDSDWGMPEQWHWMITDPRPLAEPVPAKGALGLWTPEPTVLDEIRAASRSVVAAGSGWEEGR